ncbi:MAG: GNAT family N-acetyltransferase [Marinibacterium sp.]|nr:GNAT family N-acetyltransferase [Marinibacterium sp.]
MTQLPAPFRFANPGDAAPLAELANMAGHGLPLHIWTLQARKGRSPWVIGRNRQAHLARLGQIVVADQGAGPFGAFTHHAIGPRDTPAPCDPQAPALTRPLMELERLLPQSLYLSSIACFPDHRNCGLGTQMLSCAAGLAQDLGHDRLSMIVADINDGARRLYGRLGFEEIGRHDRLDDDWDGDITAWILLSKPI